MVLETAVSGLRSTTDRSRALTPHGYAFEEVQSIAPGYLDYLEVILVVRRDYSNF